MQDTQHAKVASQAQSVTTDYRVQIRQHGGRWVTWAITDDRTKAADCHRAVREAKLAPMVRVLSVTRTLFVDSDVLIHTRADGKTKYQGADTWS